MKTIKRLWWFYIIYGIIATLLAIQDPWSLFSSFVIVVLVTCMTITKDELDRVKKHHAIEQDISENRAQTINDLRGTIERMQSKKPICVIGSDRDLKDFVREQQWARCNEKIKEGYLLSGQLGLTPG